MFDHSEDRNWDILLIQHSHIDLGFTARQEAIASYHADFVDQAVRLALSPKQDARDSSSRFRFTCEGFWQVERYLEGRTGRGVDQFRACVAAGYIELTALYLHLTELLDDERLIDTLRPAAEFCRANGLPLTAAMSCDVNGLPWALADGLAANNVRYLCSNINSHHGGYPLGGPLNAFYWESRGGERILVWNGLPYHQANLLGLMGGWTPTACPAFPGATAPPQSDAFVYVDNISFAETRVFPILDTLSAQGYRYCFLPVMGSGLYTDNSPPSDLCCDLIQEWNAKHGERIHVRTATLADLFETIEATVAEIPVYRGEWIDWWADGVAANPIDTALFRNAQRTIRAADALAPGNRPVNGEERDRVNSRLIHFAEHTFGYSDTSSCSLLSEQIFLRKTKLAAEADELASTVLDSVLRARGQAEFTASRPLSYRIFNPHPVRRSGAAYLPVDFWEAGSLYEGFRVRTAAGQLLSGQLVQDSRGVQVAVVATIEAGEYVDLTVEPSANDASGRQIEPGVFTNHYYSLRWRPTQGIYSYRDEVLGRELLSTLPDQGLACPVYQVFKGGSRSAAAGFALAPRNIPQSSVYFGTCRTCQVAEAGPVFTELRVDYEVSGARSYQVRARLFHELAQFDLTVVLDKSDVLDPEGMYVAFPFEMENAAWYLDRPGGAIRPGIDQLPGTCCDYYLVQDGAAYVGAESAIALTTVDAPLLHVGGLNLWKYRTEIEPRGPVYSWVTNNKWETNFRISCGGRYEMRYVVEAGPHLAGASGRAGKVMTQTTSISQCRMNALPFVTVRTSR